MSTIIKKYLLTIAVSLSAVLSMNAQNLTQSENYIYSRTYLEAVTSTSNTAKQLQQVGYIDGLGRPKQDISIKATATGKDIVVPVEYDIFGRQVKDMLPLPQQVTNNGGIFTVPDMTGAGTVYGTASNYYGEKKVENSPLARTQEQAAPGDPWKMANGKTVKYTYDSNTDSEVRKFVVNTTWATVSNVAVANYLLTLSVENTPYVSGGFYKAGTLYKNTVTDEDGNKTVRFTNSKGQLILSRKNDGTKNVDTYYVYNEYGQQTFVIPPLAVQTINAGNKVTPEVVDNLCYQYRYDNQDRLVEKKFPGKDWEFMVYDQQDRIVLLQDGNLRTTTNNFGAKGWIFTKYDQIGRIVYTGFFTNTATRQVMQNTLNSMSSNNEKISSNPIVQNGINIYYTKDAFPIESMNILSVNYYDQYPQDAPVRPDNILGQNTLASIASSMTVNGITTSRAIRGLPTASYVRNINDSNWTKNYIWYDLKGRQIGTHSINHLGGYTKTEAELDFSGISKQMITSHKRRNNEVGVTIKERFEYDAQNRLLKHWHQVDNRPEELLTENTYNELSQLISKKVGNGLQSIDYSYNIRGWMTGINEKEMSLANLGGKLFSYKVKYNQRDGISNPDSVLFSGKDVLPKFNGNIAEVDWRVLETPGVNPSMTPKRYGYSYDKLNRLVAGYYQNPNNPYSKENTESLAYDVNGKITNLYRTAVIENNNTTATVIDNLNYTYSGAKVSRINDNAGNSTGYEGGGNAFSYDANGNIITLLDKKINSIKYNFLNLPDKIVMSTVLGDYLAYTYSADGTKLQKINPSLECGITNCYTVSKITDYLDGFQYLSTTSSGGSGDNESLALAKEMSTAMEMQAFTSEVNSFSIVSSKTPNLQFFPTSEGYYDYEKDQYIYQYKDLSGNVRLSFGRNSAGVLEIADANDYYPFGMNHLKTGNSIFGQSSYKNYKFLGQELQETGFYDLGARLYMPELGIFGQHDPLSASTFDPYGYAYNNPIFFADPTGLEGEPINSAEPVIGTERSPIDVGEIVLNAPLREVASNLAPLMPNNCLPCNSMQGMTIGNLPPVQQEIFLPAHYYNRGLEWMGPMDLAGMLIHDVLEEQVGEQDASFLMALANVGLIATGTISKSKAVTSSKSNNIWKVGPYRKLRGIEKGLDAHHVGQSAIMKILVTGYEHKTAPTILVPAVGHRFLGPNGIVSRSTKGFTNARQVVARDIFEIRRVYGSEGVPNSALQELIQANKTMYPDAFKKK